MGSDFADSVKAIMAGNAFVSLLFAGVLQYLWGMVNTLQLINLAIIYKLLLPENMLVIQIEINKACNFDFYNTENLYMETFSFGETESFSDQFEIAGFEGSNFIIIIGPIFGFIVLLPMWFLFKELVRRICHKFCFLKCCQSIFLSHVPYFPIFITFMLESCIEIAFASTISIKMVSIYLLLTIATTDSSSVHR